MTYCFFIFILIMGLFLFKYKILFLISNMSIITVFYDKNIDLKKKSIKDNITSTNWRQILIFSRQWKLAFYDLYIVILTTIAIK